jgi:glycosyltransferase involved in cell wall biosynthesis
VLCTSPHFEPGYRGGGPIRSVARIADTLSEQVRLTIVTSDRDASCRTPYPGRSGRFVARRNATVFYLNTKSPVQWLRMWRALRRERFDLLYVNSYWSRPFTAVPILAAQLGLLRVARVLVAPRGELSAGALNLKSRRKRALGRLWRSVLRRSRPWWHATSDPERQDINATFPDDPVLLCPAQVALPDDATAPPTAGDTASLVFISRINPKKNLHIVLSALRVVRDRATLDIYGPIEDRGYWRTCVRQMRALPDNVRVRYRGTLEPGEVRATFARYDAFVFPTAGENFGHVIAESLSASCPVLCSAHTPWSRLLASGGGAVVDDLTADALGVTIAGVTSASAAARRAARVRAGEAYRSWRAATPERNVLDDMRDLARR